MSRLQLFLLKYLANRAVIQGWNHKERITQFYAILAISAKRQFTEDNAWTLELFLHECNDKALTDVLYESQTD